jgi:hypothetical protein
MASSRELGLATEINSFPGSGSRFPFSSDYFFYTIPHEKINRKSILQPSRWREADPEWPETAKEIEAAQEGFGGDE